MIVHHFKRAITTLIAVLLCIVVIGCSARSDLEPENDDKEKEDETATVKAGVNDLVAPAENEDYLIGYINTAGEWVIAPQYSSATAFVDGLALVCTDEYPGKWQIIDKSGTVTAELSEGITPVMISGSLAHDNVIGYAGPDNYGIFEGMIMITEGNKYGFVNTKAETVVEPQYDQAFNFSDGVAAVNFGTNSEPSWGYIDKQGNAIIKGTYEYAKSFSEGLAYVDWYYDDGDPDLTVGSSGFIDKKGNIIIHGTGVLTNIIKWSGFTSYLSAFKDGVAFCEYIIDDNFKVALINNIGQVIWIADDTSYISTGYGIDIINEGVFQLLAMLDDGEYGQTFLDATGSQVIAAQTTWKSDSPFNDGLLKIMNIETGKFGYLNKSNEIVITTEYQVAYTFFNGLASVMIDNEYYYIDQSGNILDNKAAISLGTPFGK